MASGGDVGLSTASVTAGTWAPMLRSRSGAQSSKQPQGASQRSCHSCAHQPHVGGGAATGVWGTMCAPRARRERTPNATSAGSRRPTSARTSSRSMTHLRNGGRGRHQPARSLMLRDALGGGAMTVRASIEERRQNRLWRRRAPRWAPAPARRRSALPSRSDPVPRHIHTVDRGQEQRRVGQLVDDSPRGPRARSTPLVRGPTHDGLPFRRGARPTRRAGCRRCGRARPPGACRAPRALPALHPGRGRPARR